MSLYRVIWFVVFIIIAENDEHRQTIGVMGDTFSRPLFCVTDTVTFKLPSFQAVVLYCHTYILIY